MCLYFYPRAPRGARPEARNLQRPAIIHFYPRAPRGARRPYNLQAYSFQWIFLPTCPARGTTRRYKRLTLGVEISTHVPREGHDTGVQHEHQTQNHFYPRAPRGARHQRRQYVCQWCGISIHVPREGRDCGQDAPQPAKKHFYPRAPRGARPYTRHSTRYSARNFYPRAPRGARPVYGRALPYPVHFYPRAPRGARQYVCQFVSLCHAFLSACPARGTTLRQFVSALGIKYFYPRAPRGARLSTRTSRGLIGGYFYPRAPRGARLYRLRPEHSAGAFLSACPARGTTSVIHL